MNRHFEAALACLIVVSPLVRAQEEPVFRADVRLIEVYAAVYDSRGRFLDGLRREQFQVKDEGAPQKILAFESTSSELSCGVLLDTTGSMLHALPYVKTAAEHLVDQLGPNDSVAIYSFGDSLEVLQDYTRDKAAAKRAIRRTRARGSTALFDAIARTAGHMSRLKKRKALVVFTDGIDNASVLHSAAAVARVRRVGIPVFAVAQGEALANTRLVEILKEISDATGGRAYAARKPEHIQNVFDDISDQLLNMYLLAYAAPPATDRKWRKISVEVNLAVKHGVRARQGYSPE
jgi:Ca-activated chloride channel family protein